MANIVKTKEDAYEKKIYEAIHGYWRFCLYGTFIGVLCTGRGTDR